MNALRPYPDARSAAKACGRRVLDLLSHVNRSGRDATLAVSGGSTPKLMLSWMAGQSFDWSRTHLFWVDERAVPPDHELSNFRMVEQALLQPASIPARNIHRVRAELEPQAAAELYAAEIREVFGSDGLPKFDVIHLGMGADAHTASLFPGEPLIEDRSGITAAVHVSKMNQSRITLLPAVLLQAAHVIVLASGEDKAEALAHVLGDRAAPLEYPLQIVAKGREDAEWFIDKSAATKV